MLFLRIREITNRIQSMSRELKQLDDIDRKLLSLLTENAELSYAVLGEKVGLSPPAVHERVKRYKKSGRIKSIVASLDSKMTGKPFLAFIHIDTTGWGKSDALMRFGNWPEVEEIHSVTGDTCVLMKVRMSSANAMEALLEKLYALPEVVSTKSYVVLSTYLERPVQVSVSQFDQDHQSPRSG